LQQVESLLLRKGFDTPLFDNNPKKAYKRKKKMKLAKTAQSRKGEFPPSLPDTPPC